MKYLINNNKFVGILVYAPVVNLNQSSIVINFDGGVGIEVVEYLGQLAVNVFLSSEFKVSDFLNIFHKIFEDFEI